MHRLALMLFGSIIVLWLVIMAALMRASALPPEASGVMLAVFEPGTSSDDAFAKLTRAGALPIRETAFGFIWVVSGDPPGLAGKLAAVGAIGTYRELPVSTNIAGCFAWADATVASSLQP